MEYARTITDENDRENLIATSVERFGNRSEINPLNTDHTANLARLYSLWSSMTEDNEKKLERARKAIIYFSRAVVLSPTTPSYGRMGVVGLD